MGVYGVSEGFNLKSAQAMLALSEAVQEGLEGRSGWDEITADGYLSLMLVQWWKYSNTRSVENMKEFLKLAFMAFVTEEIWTGEKN